MNKCKQIKIDYNFKLKIISYTANKTWDKAQAWAKQQGGRVPTVVELQMLSALQRVGKLDTKFTGWFWSSEECSFRPQDVGMYVHFNSCNTSDNWKDYKVQALCVKDI